MIKTPLPVTRQKDTGADKFFAYLASHVTRSTDAQPIATIPQDQSARRTWTTPQITILCILATLTIIALWTFGIVILTAIFAAVTVLYVALLCLSAAWMIAIARATPSTPFDDEIIRDLSDAPWPSYTILCPLYREKAVVPQFVDAMKALDYPSDCLQVLFLTEEDDEETRRAILALNLPAHFQVVTVPQGTPKTKPRACNYGLQQATGEYVVIFDAEDIPDLLQLKKAVLTFASTNVNVACVQAKLNFYNPVQNLLTRFFTIEYSLWFDLILPGLQRLGFSLPLGGTSNHFRISALKALGGWDAFNVTEDCDLGLKLAKYGFRTIMLDSTTYEEANSRKLSWIRQRSRWIKGYMQTYLVHTRHPLSALKKGKIKDLLSLHLFVGAGSIILLINPVMWAMFAAYLIWHPVDLYHQLFPWPVLYAGMLCFLVGNFLPIYVSMLACVKREHYTLVKWCLFLPLYWVLLSLAAFLAGYELIVKPHHWHKTQHGLHLQGKKSTNKVAAISMKYATVLGGSVAKVGTVTQSVRAMSTVLVPAVNKARVRKKSVRSRDPWLMATIVLACVCSIVATTYFFQHHEILLYGDAYSHMRVIRRTFDTLHPGLAQLGTVWLPLPHILMFPFIWNDTLWHTGLAGAFVGMGCYVISAVYLYRSIRLITLNAAASVIGALAFLLNPNILYLQSTPLSELVCVATFLMGCFYFLSWVYTQSTPKLVLSGVCTFLATLARYDGWALFAGLFILVLLVGWLKHLPKRQIESNAIVFGLPGGIGIILWLIWNWVISGDPFYFQDGLYSTQYQQLSFLNKGILYTYHNVWQSIRFYVYAASENTGIILCIIAAIALIVFFVRFKITPKSIAICAFLAPFAFYVLALYQGNAAIYVPGAEPVGAPYTLFNVRYGAQMVAPVSLFVGLGIAQLYSFVKKRKAIVILLAIALVVGQMTMTIDTGIVSLQDGLHGLSCYPIHSTDLYLAQHYNGGFILDDTVSTNDDASIAGIDFRQIIDQTTTRSVWIHALSSPSSVVDWILIRKDSNSDEVVKHVNLRGSAFLANFVLVSQDTVGGLALYHHTGRPPLPTRPLPSRLLPGNINTQCSTGKNG